MDSEKPLGNEADNGSFDASSILDACAEGQMPTNIALLRLAIEAPDSQAVERAITQAMARQDARRRSRLEAALGLWRENPQAFDLVQRVLAGVEHHGVAADPAEALPRWADLFDRMARTSAEGSVALYAFGNPDLLKAATEEVVTRLDEWDCLGPSCRVLEIGCGIGRFVAALAPRVGHVTGLDISPEMTALAQARCAGLSNVALRLTSGRDLSGLGDGTFDLVLAADVFPYLVQSGGDAAFRHVEEAARVLTPSGRLVILNYSYRGAPERDRAELAQAATACGLDFLRASQGDFAHWDAPAYVLRKG
jgi:SAM-dependent methyltransferase